MCGSLALIWFCLKLHSNWTWFFQQSVFPLCGLNGKGLQKEDLHLWPTLCSLFQGHLFNELDSVVHLLVVQVSALLSLICMSPISSPHAVVVSLFTRSPLCGNVEGHGMHSYFGLYFRR
ncbi:UNVERIFIED_CONTAM: hypothetical protein K2H54_041542 [Gekko kuhli]